MNLDLVSNPHFDNASQMWKWPWSNRTIEHLNDVAYEKRMRIISSVTKDYVKELEFNDSLRD